MADVAADSNTASQIKITVDPGKSDDESQNNGSGEDENHSEVNSDSVETVKAVAEPLFANSAVSSGKLFLRPSALSRDGLKPCATNASTPSLIVSNSSNKFSGADESPESLFSNSSPASDKPEAKPTIPAPVRPVTVSLSNPDYVFGQNLSDRVVESVSNGTGSMLFSSVLNAESKKKEDKENDAECHENSSTSLLEDAARCQEQRAAKRKYDEVQVTTGEENETNILQITVKLFAFEGGSWVERGRGTLRLNDVENSGSRIVVRTLGSLRVVLNTKIWSGMELSRASEKSIRTTAMDTFGVLKIFLIQANSADITTLFDLMQERIRRSQSGAVPAEPVSKANETKSEETGEEAPPSAKVAALEKDS